MSYKAPPGSWRQFLALIVGVVLLVILAPSGTSASTSRRTRRVVFSAKNIGEHGISSSSQTRNNHNNDGGSNGTNDSSSSNSATASNYEESKKKKLYTNKSIDPSKWKRLNAPHSIIKSELIGDRIESSALNPSTLKDQEKSQNDVKLRTEDDDVPLSSIHQGIKQSTEEDEQNSGDQWYVLNNIQWKKDVSYELKVMFPLETPVNVDLDVSVWTLVGAQAQIMNKIRLADHYSEDSVLFARVRYSRDESTVETDGLITGESPRRPLSRLLERRIIRPSTDKDCQVEYSVEVDRLYWNNQVSHSGLSRGIAISSAVGVVAVLVQGYIGYVNNRSSSARQVFVCE